MISANKIEILRIAEAVAQEKMIDKEIVISALEEAMVKAAKNNYGEENDVFAEIDNENSEMLMTILRKNTQVFYATTTKNRHVLLEDKVMFNINKGQFISESI